MEFARHEHEGDISSELCRRIVQALLGGQGFSHEAFDALIRYLHYVDVQLCVFQAIKRLMAPPQEQVENSAGTGNVDRARAKNDSLKEEVVAPQIRGEAAQADICRNCFDTLSSAPLIFGDFHQAIDAKHSQPSARSKEHFNGPHDEAANENEEEKISAWSFVQSRIEDAFGRQSNSNSQGESMLKKKRKRSHGSHGAKWMDASVRRKAFKDAWLSLLRADMPSDVYRRVLMHLPEGVIPYMSNPLLLSDFLSGAVSTGGFDAMLALGGLFKLMTDHGLEYEGFYRRVYSLLTEDAFYSPHRKRFFDLLSEFLRSSLLSAYNAAAFMKLIARHALRAPPHGCLIAIAIVHNLARRHPACSVLLHRKCLPASAKGLDDPFDANDSNPATCRAIESSLWEATALQKHYTPEVARFASVLERDHSKRSKVQELRVAELTSRNYDSLIDEELRRRLKAAPTAYYVDDDRPTGLFERSGATMETHGTDSEASMHSEASYGSARSASPWQHSWTL